MTDQVDPRYHALASEVDGDVATVLTVHGKAAGAIPEAVTAGALAAVIRNAIETSGIAPDDLLVRTVTTSLGPLLHQLAAVEVARFKQTRQ